MDKSHSEFPIRKIRWIIGGKVIAIWDLDDPFVMEKMSDWRKEHPEEAKLYEQKN